MNPSRGARSKRKGFNKYTLFNAFVQLTFLKSSRYRQSRGRWSFFCEVVTPGMVSPFAEDPMYSALILSLIHISEPTRPLYISYAVFCLKKKKNNKQTYTNSNIQLTLRI
eukprot:TRINITY_DN28505_c0_g1_i2.p2 TRINITY_DN28505_c0_g1~~TRINITY_DN28505_c0_g1_i2.p2  ORF type:complete len:110 (+),score=8.66 TRINITY_DN28505_c0_g1_i2:316-645(+)